MAEPSNLTKPMDSSVSAAPVETSIPPAMDEPQETKSEATKEANADQEKKSQ